MTNRKIQHTILLASLLVFCVLFSKNSLCVSAKEPLSTVSTYLAAEKTGDYIRTIINRLLENKKMNFHTDQSIQSKVVETEGKNTNISKYIPFEKRNIISMGRSDILRATSSNTPDNTLVCWDGFSTQKNDFNNGVIPSEWLDDPVYCSMNLPSECVSDYMMSVGRDNAHILDAMTPVQTTAVSIGAIYPSSGANLPDTFTICLGKIKLFAYSKNQNQWVVVDSQPYPKGFHIFTLPWSNNSRKCENVTYFDDHAEVSLTRNDLTNAVLHFWGNRLPVNKDDYLYYAAAYEFYVKESDAVNTMTATLGIDSKDANGNNIVQLFSSRGLAVNTNRRVHWGHTIPNSQYVPEIHGKALKGLF